MVEEQLPKSIKAQWCLEVCDEHGGVDERNKFPAFLKFLLKHKRAVEYGASDLRTVAPQKYGSTNFGQGSLKSAKTEKEVCWIHKEVDQHPIWKCREFISMTVPERMSLALSNKACLACLLVRCPGASSADRCIGRFKCRAAGCGKRHNRLLHTPDMPSSRATDPTPGIIGTANHATDGQETNRQEQFAIPGAAILPIQIL